MDQFLHRDTYVVIFKPNIRCKINEKVLFLLKKNNDFNKL